MINFFWNYRGLGSNTVVRALNGQIRKLRPSMVFLSETKMKDHKIDGVRRRMGFTRGFNVPPIGKAGGLSLWWDDSVEVEILFSSQHVIDARVRITGIYGTSYKLEKVEMDELPLHSLRHAMALWWGF